MLGFKRYIWGTVLSVSFVAALIGCFTAPTRFYFWMAVLAACGTGVAALYCFLYPPEPKPFRRVFHHDDWAFGDGTEFPRLLIPAAMHGMGKSPAVEFAQGAFTYPCEVLRNGDIVIIRTNHSLGRFADMEVTIRRKAL